MRGKGKQRGKRFFVVGRDAPRWGSQYDDPDRMSRIADWAERVGQSEPTPLRRCGPCGGWATKDCKH